MAKSEPKSEPLYDGVDVDVLHKASRTLVWLARQLIATDNLYPRSLEVGHILDMAQLYNEATKATKDNPGRALSDALLFHEGDVFDLFKIPNSVSEIHQDIFGIVVAAVQAILDRKYQDED